mmetsp:Transcript_26651/g.82460  ORF Transcript_26651/g.82460 Transcript_26651/m.82460 type:complete len:211 (-) Transcript_26651:57-689(-)
MSAGRRWGCGRAHRCAQLFCGHLGAAAEQGDEEVGLELGQLARRLEAADARHVLVHVEVIEVRLHRHRRRRQQQPVQRVGGRRRADVVILVQGAAQQACAERDGERVTEALRELCAVGGEGGPIARRRCGVGQGGGQRGAGDGGRSVRWKVAVRRKHQQFASSLGRGHRKGKQGAAQQEDCRRAQCGVWQWGAGAASCFVVEPGRSAAIQ